MKHRTDIISLFRLSNRFGLWLPLTLGILAGGVGCVETCSPLLGKSAQGRAYLAKKVVEDYFESIIIVDQKNEKYWCDPKTIKYRFKNLSEYHIIRENAGGQKSDESLSNWYSFKVITRTRNTYGGVITGIYFVYVKMMHDGLFKIFALLPEEEAAFWESVNKKIQGTDLCSFPSD